jgi:sodium-coupled monocarboxylate transporter 8/12
MVSICCAAGLVIFTKYQNCDPFTNKQVTQIDQLFPHFVMETLGFLPGFPGIPSKKNILFSLLT